MWKLNMDFQQLESTIPNMGNLIWLQNKQKCDKLWQCQNKSQPKMGGRKKNGE